MYDYENILYHFCSNDFIIFLLFCRYFEYIFIQMNLHFFLPLSPFLINVSLSFSVLQ